VFRQLRGDPKEAARAKELGGGDSVHKKKKIQKHLQAADNKNLGGKGGEKRLGAQKG